MKKYCIIVAGGSGQRMRSSLPKQFLLLDGRPLLMHTVERFHSFDTSIEIIVVLPAEHRLLWQRLAEEYSFDIRHEVIDGGEERFHSVKAGLERIRAEGLVAIHDGVRPLVSHDTIWRCFADAEEYGNAVPFVEPADSVRFLEGEES
ncbi:MAG: 2-C-methyl-D-erythritol 4-phosphate cytidylyltransferase, partial [Bacteroidales bacterium]|nr:2-C-methyl-D-erythritol 4-phosphate cytidylyltransferase [Bacteroidales bacterium]